MPSKVIRCPNSIPCLGIESLDGDYPIRNLSAEEPDVPLYTCTVFSRTTPILGVACASYSTVAVASSRISQANACDLAQLIADDNACPGGNPGGNPEITDQDQPPPTVPCTEGSCEEAHQCVNGECIDIPPVNDFAPVGTNPRRPTLPIRIGALTPNKCCVDTDYSGTISATGFEPFIWTVDGGLPPGLSLANGAITGTPTMAGTFAFTVTVQAADGGIAHKTLTLSVLEIVTASPLPTGQALQAYNETLTQVGGTAPISWQIAGGALPPGLALDESTGVISGTPPAMDGALPNAGGTYNFTVSMQDEAT